MTPQKIRHPQGITLLGAGPASSQSLETALEIAPALVAVDGGANRALDLGLTPLAVIGDLDSVDRSTLADLSDARVLHIAEQDTTDFEKALSHVEAPLILALGFTGGRLDHSLATLSVILRFHDIRLALIAEDDIVIALPRRIELDLLAGDRVSIFPFAQVTARSSGLHWPLDGLELDPLGRIGTSNRATGRVVIESDGPGALLLLPRSRLRAALDALEAARIQPPLPRRRNRA